MDAFSILLHGLFWTRSSSVQQIRFSKDPGWTNNDGPETSKCQWGDSCNKTHRFGREHILSHCPWQRALPFGVWVLFWRPRKDLYLLIAMRRLIQWNSPLWQGTHSAVLCTAWPWHGAPPFSGCGSVQVLVRRWPRATRPLHRHCVHGPQELQPPFTVGIKGLR